MITIIGAGPAGSYLAYLLANKEVQVFEDHNTIGKPVQCTGIITQSIKDIINIKKRFLINQVTRTKVISQDGKSIDVKLRRPNLIIDRTEFDRYLAEKAEDKGAKFHLNHKYIDCREKNGRIELKLDGKTKTTETDILVGADGPFSRVARTNNLWQNRKYVIGAQARVNIETEPDQVEFFLNKGSFGWVVPENEKTARVGIACYTNTKEHFNSLLKRKNISKIKEHQSGFIPVYNPKIRTQNRNAYLVGDAATQVKATTFGGIIQGMIAAEELSKAIQENKNYEKLWRKRIGKELLISLMIRNKMNNFSDKKYNELLKLINQKRIKSIIETHDRDYPSRFIFKLLLKEPRFLKLIF